MSLLESCLLLALLLIASIAVSPGMPGRPPDALSRYSQGQDRLRIRRRPVAGIELRRRGAAHHPDPGRGAFPKFSPDGKWIAFTGQYDGNFNVYVMPAEGGQPRQLTFYQGQRAAAQRAHGHPQRGGHLDPGQQAHPLSLAPRHLQQLVRRLYSVSIDGGLPEPLPMDQGGLTLLFARRHQDRLQPHLPQLPHLEALHRRHGAGHLHLRLQEQHRSSVPHTDWTDTFPMWHGNTIYFTSDRGPEHRLNLYSYDLGSQADRATHTLHRIRRDVAQPGARRHHLRERRLSLHASISNRSSRRS